MDTTLPSDSPAMQPSSSGTLRRSFRAARRSHLIVLGIYAAVFVFMFRALLAAMPEILDGSSFVAAHELIPIFDFGKQFVEPVLGNFSDLTNMFEIRVRYAVLTAWMRYYTVIPIALVVTSILTAFANYLITLAFASKILKRDPDALLVRAAALANLFAYFILLYTKILFYFSMLIGYTMFLLSLYLLVQALFYEEKRPYRYMISSAALFVFNPTIHFLVLHIFIIFLLLPFVWAAEAKPSADLAKKAWKESARKSPVMKWLIALFWLFLVGALPYALFVKLYVLKGFENVAEDIPVYHFFIKANSIPLLQFLSFDSGAITDGYLYGRYIPLYPRLTNIFYSLLIFLPLAPSAFRSLFPDRQSKRSAILLAYLFLVALWCSLGYYQNSFIPSFYETLAVFVNGVYGTSSSILHLVSRAVEVAVQILRAPHRFQFIALMCGTVLMTCALTHLQERASARWEAGWKRRLIPTLLLPVVFFIPLLANWDYRTTLTSGDFAQYLAPYPTEDLRGIRDVLDGLPEGKTIMLPPAGAQQRILDDNGVQHKFLEKIFIFYLNKSSYYYGSDSSLFNKNSFFFLLWALQNNENWWINILADLNVEYLIINKTSSADRFSPRLYLSNLDGSLPETLRETGSLFEKIYENKGYILYKFRHGEAISGGRPLYYNVDWATFRCTQEKMASTTGRPRMLLNSYEFDISQPMDLLANDPKKAAMDLYAKSNPELLARPSTANYAFNPNVIPSSTYYNIIYPMFNVFTNSRFNYLNMIVPGTFDTLFGAFVGLPKSAPLKFEATLPESGTYDLYLRAMPTKNNLRVHVDGKEINSLQITGSNTTYVRSSTLYALQKEYVDASKLAVEQLSALVPRAVVPMGNQYEYVKIGTATLEQGEHTVLLEKLDQSPIVMEGILFLNTDTLPNGPSLPANVRSIHAIP